MSYTTRFICHYISLIEDCQANTGKAVDAIQSIMDTLAQSHSGDEQMLELVEDVIQQLNIIRVNNGQ